MRAWWYGLRHPLGALRVLRSDWQAWRRGQHRLVPRVGPTGGWARGRIYSAPAQPPEFPRVTTEAEASLTVVVTRASGEVETYSYPARKA